jgi:hypothetical protein
VQFHFDDRDRDFVNRHYTANLPPGLVIYRPDNFLIADIILHIVR